MEANQLEALVRHIKGNIAEGGAEEDVDVSIEIPPHILKTVLDNSCKRKAEGSIDCRHCRVPASAHSRCCDTAETVHSGDLGDVEGDRQARLEEYYNWGLTQVESDRWREALQRANQVAMQEFLELNTILQYPKVTTELMVKKWVPAGIALQFVSNIRRFQREKS